MIMFGRIVTGLLRFMFHCLRLLKKMIFQKANIANTLLRYLVQEPFPIRTCLNFYCHCPLYVLHWCSDIPHMPGTCATYDLACQVPKKSPSQKLFAYYVWSTSVCSQRTRSYGPLPCWNLRRPFPADKKNMSDSSASTYFAEIFRTLGKYLPCVFFW